MEEPGAPTRHLYASVQHMPGLHVFVELLRPDALISVIAKERYHLHVEIHSKRDTEIPCQNPLEQSRYPYQFNASSPST